MASLLYVLPLNFPADDDEVLFGVSDVWPLDGWSDYQPDSSLRLTLENVSILPPETEGTERAPKSYSTQISKDDMTVCLISRPLPSLDLTQTRVRAMPGHRCGSL